MSQVIACADQASGPVIGAAEVTVSTSGASLDPDGYSVRVDSGPAQALAINGTLILPGLEAGDHVIALRGVAANCAVTGDSLRVARVSAGATAEVAFSVVCAATTQRLLFVSDRSGTDEIYAMNPDGTGVARLSFDSLGAVYPDWSPDGTRFVYAAVRSTPDIFTRADYALTIRNLDGSGARTVAYLNQVFVPVAAWSPDGSRIAFVSNVVGHGLQIFVVNPDGTGLRQLTDLSVSIGVAWSPDGSKIAVSAYGGAKYNIFVLNVNDATLTQLTSTSGGTDREPAWSPDGSRIAFVSDRGGDDEIYVMNADGSGEVRLTTSPSPDLWPAWSPDGLRIAFDSHRQGNTQIYITDLDGSGQMPITTNAWNDMMPSWSR